MGEALGSWVQVAAVILGGMGVAAAGIGHLIRSFKSGQDEVEDRVIKLTQQENEALARKVETLEAELHDAHGERKFLEGRVDELSQQNAQLAALIAGDKVPKGLEDALTGITQRIIARIEDSERATLARLEQSEEATSQGVIAVADAIQKVLSRVAGPSE